MRVRKERNGRFTHNHTGKGGGASENNTSDNPPPDEGWQPSNRNSISWKKKESIHHHKRKVQRSYRYRSLEGSKHEKEKKIQKKSKEFHSEDNHIFEFYEPDLLGMPHRCGYQLAAIRNYGSKSYMARIIRIRKRIFRYRRGG